MFPERWSLRKNKVIVSEIMKIKQFLSKKAGVTLLEGLIAIALLALVAGGTFGVLLSVSRTTDQPDRREDMIYAVEQVNQLLKANIGQTSSLTETEYNYLKNLLCYGSPDNNTTPFAVGGHSIKCLLPPSCDRSSSAFSYTITTDSQNVNLSNTGLPASYFETNNVASPENSGNGQVQKYKISYYIECNGYTL